MEIKMLPLAVILPLLIWGLFMPLAAAACYLALVLLFEGALLMDLTLRRPALKDPTLASTPEQMMIRRYHQFLRYPAAAVANSRVCEGSLDHRLPRVRQLLSRERVGLDPQSVVDLGKLCRARSKGSGAIEYIGVIA